MRQHHIQLTFPRADFILHVDLYLPAVGITVVMGASGSGKTSLLRCVAGLEHAPQGVVEIAGELWQGEHVFMPTWQRRVGYVFQEPGLFGHLSVEGNLRYALKRCASPQSEKIRETAIRLLGIAPLLSRRVQQLSGGEQQRVAIARALVTQPRLLLLDEPLASLDQARREEVLPWLERLRDEWQIPMLYVTHSESEMTCLADTLVLLEHGQVRLAGAVTQVLPTFEYAACRGDAAGVLLSGRVLKQETKWHLVRIGFSGGELLMGDTGLLPQQAVRLRVLARDVSITAHPQQQTSIQNQLPCRVESMAPDHHSAHMLIRLQCGESYLLARVTHKAVQELSLVEGLSVWAQVKSVALVL